MSFCTAVTCMDGRIQDPVTKFLRKRFGAAYVDVVTEAGPVALVADRSDRVLPGILHRVEISMNAHASKGVAVVAHADCAGNPVPDSIQKGQLVKARSVLRGALREKVEVAILWVDKQGRVEELERN